MDQLRKLFDLETVKQDIEELVKIICQKTGSMKDYVSRRGKSFDGKMVVGCYTNLLVLCTTGDEEVSGR